MLLSYESFKDATRSKRDQEKALAIDFFNHRNRKQKEVELGKNKLTLRDNNKW